MERIELYTPSLLLASRPSHPVGAEATGILITSSFHVDMPAILLCSPSKRINNAESNGHAAVNGYIYPCQRQGNQAFSAVALVDSPERKTMSKNSSQGLASHVV
jgi:hypothetical protein